MTDEPSENPLQTAEIHLDEVRDISTVSAPIVAVVEHLAEFPGERLGIIEDGRVVAVVMDRMDAALFEHLQVRYESEPGKHQERGPRVTRDQEDDR